MPFANWGAARRTYEILDTRWLRDHCHMGKRKLCPGRSKGAAADRPADYLSTNTAPDSAPVAAPGWTPRVTTHLRIGARRYQWRCGPHAPDADFSKHH